MSNVTIVLAFLRKPNGNSKNHNCSVENFVIFEHYNVTIVLALLRKPKGNS